MVSSLKDIEDISVTLDSIPERLLANPLHNSRPNKMWILNGKGFLGEAIELNVIDCRGSMGLLKVVAL